MEEFYYNVITFWATMDSTTKMLVIGILSILIVLEVVKIVKTHVNPKKTIFKVGQFLVLAILVTVTIFITVHAYL